MTDWNGPVSIQPRDEQTGKPLVTTAIATADRAAFEAEEEELDGDDGDDEACLPITQELTLSLGSRVLHLATPTIDKPSSSTDDFDPDVPLMMQLNIVVVAACADSSVRLITLPLTPPTTAAKIHHTLGAQICDLAPAVPGQALSRAVALSWTSASANSTDVSMEPQDQRLDLLVALSVAGVAGALKFFRIPLQFDDEIGPVIPSEATPFHTVQLATPPDRISFNSAVYPSPRHSQLLLADKKGFLKVYDPLASETSATRPTSQDSSRPSATPSPSWLVTFTTPFHLPKDNATTYAGLAKRKSILDAQWVSAGRTVLVLLSDGEWGVWNIDGGGPASLTNATPTSLTTFTIRGDISQTSNAESSAASNLTTRTNHRLAPMTPNTRKARQESLFSGPSTTTFENAHKGGMSVAATTTSHGTPDDSVIMWYGGEAYHVPSLVSLWQRSVNSSGRDVGSLYGPGLAHIEGLDMSGETLNSIAQFPARSTNTAANIGNITHRDMIVTGEYRFIIISSVRPQTPAKSLFARGEVAGSPKTTTFDLQLLEKGELDLGGVDRLLDGMTGIEKTNGFGKPKRVGFAR